MPFLPIHDDSVRRHIGTPYVGWGVIFACILALIWQEGQSPEGYQAVVLSLGVIPATLFGHAELDPALAVVPPWATLVTSIFLHGGFGHLLGNMLFLYVFGDNVEDSMGHGRFALFLTICGMTAGLSLALTDTTSVVPLIGASGAVSGVLGAYIFLHPRARITVLAPFFIPIRLPAWLLIAFWFGAQLLSGAATGGESDVAWWAHVGGFLAGVLLLPFFRQRDVPLLD